MRLSHPDYIKLVIAAYKKKLANNELSPLLSQSTPAKIRRECANVYQERYEKKDEPMLRAFFGPAEHGRKFLAAIHEFEVDRFRPLDIFLKGNGNKGISDRNLGLLAWLIDFRHRPWTFDMKVDLTEEEVLIIKNDEEDGPLPPVEDIVEAISNEAGSFAEVATGAEPTKKDETNPVFSDALIRKSGNGSQFKKPALIFLLLVIFIAGIASTVWQQTQHQQTEMGTAFPDVPSITLQSQLSAAQKKDTVSEHLKSAPLKSSVDNKKKIALPAVAREADRCQAITKKGTRCKRSAKSSGYCLQHVRMVALNGVKATFLKSFLPGTDFQTITCIAMQKRL